MLRTLVGELPDRIGQRVLLQGWVHRRRRLGAVAFLLVRDRSGVAQVVLSDGAVLDALPEETVIAVEGTVTAREQAPGGVELTSPQVTALSAPAATPPVQLWRPALDVGLPTVLDHAPVVWRHRTRQALWRIAASSVRGFRRVLDPRGFTEIHTPKLVAGATESGANVFTVDYFGRPAYLAQSPQLYKQIMVGVFERVYETGPVFRAEPHDTSRHSPPSTNACSGPGRGSSTGPTSWPWRATRPASAPSTRTPSPATPPRPTRSTCSSAARSW